MVCFDAAAAGGGVYAYVSMLMFYICMFVWLSEGEAGGGMWLRLWGSQHPMSDGWRESGSGVGVELQSDRQSTLLTQTHIHTHMHTPLSSFSSDPLTLKDSESSTSSYLCRSVPRHSPPHKLALYCVCVCVLLDLGLDGCLPPLHLIFFFYKKLTSMQLLTFPFNLNHSTICMIL